MQLFRMIFVLITLLVMTVGCGSKQQAIYMKERQLIVNATEHPFSITIPYRYDDGRIFVDNAWFWRYTYNSTLIVESKRRRFVDDKFRVDIGDRKPQCDYEAAEIVPLDTERKTLRYSYLCRKDWSLVEYRGVHISEVYEAILAPPLKHFLSDARAIVDSIREFNATAPGQ